MAAADARYCALTLYAEDMRDESPSTLQPPADPRIEADGWRLEADSTGQDVLFDLGLRTFYGFVARAIDDPAEHVVVVRGTADFIEWAIDAEFVLRSYPGPGRVEDGFYGVYQSLALQLPSGPEAPVLAGIASIVGDGHVTVAGHSLGGAIAIYLATDLARVSVHTAGRFFAAPHPGDAAFVSVAAASIVDYASYAYARDIVPLLPLGLGFESLPARVTLPANPQIRGGLFCNHHAACYTYLLDPAALHGAPIDAQYLACISAVA